MSITSETRKESYKAILPIAYKRRDAILEILGDKEMTATEIAECLFQRGLTPYYERNFASPRLTELKSMGKVRATGKILCERTSKMVALWRKA